MPPRLSLRGVQCVSASVARLTPGREIRVPGNRGHVAVLAPELMPDRHVWSWWGKCNAVWKRAHEAQLAMLRERQRNAGPTTIPFTPSMVSDGKFLAGIIAGSVATATV